MSLVRSTFCIPTFHPTSIMSMSTRSKSLSPGPVKAATKAGAGLTLGTANFQLEVLEANNILLEDTFMGEDRWSDIAFSIGMPAKAQGKSNNETGKVAQRMNKRKHVSYPQTFETIKPLLDSVVVKCPKISQQFKCIFHGDAVPTEEAIKNTILRLPTPRPAISLGYYRDAFSAHHDELQNGIIIGPYGEPCDLNHLSQPVLGHYWPFLVIEISDTSMSAARQASAITAATCNNALLLLAGAVASADGLGNSFAFDTKFARSFSLSIYDKSAILSTHSAEGLIPHLASPIASYRLDSERDVAALADRVYSILIWAQHSRLGEICAMLDALDKKVHGHLSEAGNGDVYDFDPSCLKKLKLQPPRRPDRIKVAIKAGLPWWLGK